MICDHCRTRRAHYAVWDEPENEAALILGDEVLGLLLCGVCLEETLAEGPWDGVELLDPAA